MKPYDPFVKAFTLHKDLNWNRMVDYLEDGVHPGCHQLSSPSDFLFATGTQKPLVVFFDPLDSKNSEGFKKSAAEQQSGDRIAHFSAVTGFDLFGLYVMSVFNVNSPSYIVIRRQVLSLFNFKLNSFFPGKRMVHPHKTRWKRQFHWNSFMGSEFGASSLPGAHWKLQVPNCSFKSVGAVWWRGRARERVHGRGVD